mmetsp:Transcript_56357/g.132214  ORF Transcript_56357/g.132214 Transcript_56357/m.132214 type:complete len:201 (-) Transcript_56357:933-1535(-)
MWSLDASGSRCSRSLLVSVWDGNFLLRPVKQNRLHDAAVDAGAQSTQDRFSAGLLLAIIQVGVIFVIVRASAGPGGPGARHGLATAGGELQGGAGTQVLVLLQALLKAFKAQPLVRREYRSNVLGQLLATTEVLHLLGTKRRSHLRAGDAAIAAAEGLKGLPEALLASPLVRVHPCNEEFGVSDGAILVQVSELQQCVDI